MDSGGYPDFLAREAAQITEEGVQFQNHLDGTPTSSRRKLRWKFRAAFGGDIAMMAG